MTVLIAAAGDVGRTARDRLADAGFDVEHVTTLSAARVRAATVDAVVAGALEDATARDLRTALRSSGAGTPFVHLGPDEAFETTVERPFDAAALSSAVRLVEQTSRYQRAIDDFYEQCRARATAGDENPAGDEAVAAAKRRAEREFREVRRLDDGPPFERLFDSSSASDQYATDWPGMDDDDADGDADDDAANGEATAGEGCAIDDNGDGGQT